MDVAFVGRGAVDRQRAEQTTAGGLEHRAALQEIQALAAILRRQLWAIHASGARFGPQLGQLLRASPSSCVACRSSGTTSSCTNALTRSASAAARTEGVKSIVGLLGIMLSFLTQRRRDTEERRSLISLRLGVITPLR